MLAAGLRTRRPGRRLGPEPRRVGADPVRDREGSGVILVNINPAYRTQRARVRARPVGLPLDRRRARAEGLGLRRDGRRRSAPTCPTLERAVFFELRRVGGARRATTSPATLRRARRASSTSTTRSTSSTRAARPASPRARRSPTTTSSTTATSSPALLGYTEADRVCIPVPLYHCFGMVMGNLGATNHGACMVYPAETFDPVATLEACAEERCTSLYGVPTMFIAAARPPALLRVRPRARCAPGSWPARRARSR